MNSMSRGYYEPCGKERKREEEKCPTIIKCGCPGSATIPVGTAVGTTFTLTSLTLDTSCICDPSIKVDFTSNIVAPEDTTAGAVTIQIFKQCKYQVSPVPVGSAYAFSTTDPISLSFPLFVCDSDSCDHDCCTYTAVATVTTAPVGAALSINNAALSAIATCKSSCHKCK